MPWLILALAVVLVLMQLSANRRLWEVEMALKLLLRAQGVDMYSAIQAEEARAWLAKQADPKR